MFDGCNAKFIILTYSHARHKESACGKSTPTEHPYTLIYRLRSANEGNTDMGVP